MLTVTDIRGVVNLRDLPHLTRSLSAGLAVTRFVDEEAPVLGLEQYGPTSTYNGTCPSCAGWLEATPHADGVSFRCSGACSVEAIRNAIERALACHRAADLVESDDPLFSLRLRSAA